MLGTKPLTSVFIEFDGVNPTESILRFEVDEGTKAPADNFIPLKYKFMLILILNRRHFQMGNSFYLFLSKSIFRCQVT